MLLADEYALYVIAAYAATAVILGALVWSSVVASRRARRELAGLERERERERRG
jgi:heme exporter protein CcmD